MANTTKPKCPYCGGATRRAGEACRSCVIEDRIQPLSKR